MFKFNNDHIFTGYLKQLLASVNIPTCKIYTKDFAEYLKKFGREDPRIIESLDQAAGSGGNTRISYLKDNELYSYFWKYFDGAEKQDLGHSNAAWLKMRPLYYDSTTAVPGLTKTLKSQGRFYDKTTHEYLGEYLRFMRDYYGINLLSMYNCFNNEHCDNIYLSLPSKNILFDSTDPNYHIYAIPVKLFSDYTIALDSRLGVEMFCGFYNTSLDSSDKAIDFIAKTYKKVNKAIFKQPFVYDKLNIKQWLTKKADGSESLPYEAEVLEVSSANGATKLKLNPDILSRREIALREQDLKLFIKVPTHANTSIVILEGDFCSFNNCSYRPVDKHFIIHNCHVGENIKLILREPDSTPETAVYNMNLAARVFNAGGRSNPPEAIWSGNYVAPTTLDSRGWCLITCGEELAWVIKNGGSAFVNNKEVRHFKLTKDIYLNDTTKIDWKTGDVIGDYVIRQWIASSATDQSAKPFYGTIDGDGHGIYGLYSNNQNKNTSGGLLSLVALDKTTMIKNLSIDYVFLYSTNPRVLVGNEIPTKTKLDLKAYKMNTWQYNQNHAVLNFGAVNTLNSSPLVPISKLQLLELNTGESYPFADRLVEYLVGSAIMPTDKIADNIKRVQKVMNKNNQYFRVSGAWEPKMQKLIYDYIMCSGPISLVDGKLIDKRTGYHVVQGHVSKSTLYDVLGYVDKDAENWYANWHIKDGKACVHDSIKNIDIYDGLYDI